MLKIYLIGIGSRKGKHYHEKVLHKQELTLASFPENNNTLDAGVHRWAFQFIVSNSLVETIEDEMSKVFYYLTATVHRVGKSITNPKCRRDILLLRIPDWSNDDLIANNLPATSITSDRRLPTCDVHLCIDKSSASAGTPFPISIKISPNIKHLFLESISVILSEKKIYQLPEFQAKRIEYNDYKVSLVSSACLVDPTLNPFDTCFDLKEINRILHVKNAHIPLDEQPFLYRLIFTLPNCVHMIHSSSFSELTIRHTLNIKIGLSSETHESPIRIHFETPVTILDCRLKGDFNKLPTYEEAALRLDTCQGHQQEFFVCPRYTQSRKKQTRSDAIAQSPSSSSTSLASVQQPPPAYETI